MCVFKELLKMVGKGNVIHKSGWYPHIDHLVVLPKVIVL